MSDAPWSYTFTADDLARIASWRRRIAVGPTPAPSCTEDTHVIVLHDGAPCACGRLVYDAARHRVVETRITVAPDFRITARPS